MNITDDMVELAARGICAEHGWDADAPVQSEFRARAMSKKEQARDLMGRIRYQVFAPEVTTMGPCPRCGVTSRGSDVCAGCHAEELDKLVGHPLGSDYEFACCQQHSFAQHVLKAALALDNHSTEENSNEQATTE